MVLRLGKFRDMGRTYLPPGGGYIYGNGEFEEPDRAENFTGSPGDLRDRQNTLRGVRRARDPPLLAKSRTWHLKP